MTTLLRILLPAGLVAADAGAGASAVTKHEAGPATSRVAPPLLSVTAGGLTRVIWAWGDDSFRVVTVLAGTADPKAELAPMQAQALLAVPPAAAYAAAAREDGLAATNGNLAIVIAGDGAPLATITRKSDGRVHPRDLDRAGAAAPRRQ